MKIINKTLIFLFVALFSRSIDIDIKSPQCAIGSIEAEHFAKANHKIPLISYSDFSNHIENLIRYDQRFTNTSFINTQLINIAPDTLVLKNGSCIKINSNHNQIESIIFISNNHRMEWEEKCLTRSIKRIAKSGRQRSSSSIINTKGLSNSSANCVNSCLKACSVFLSAS